jgi:hypothetical protein
MKISQKITKIISEIDHITGKITPAPSTRSVENKVQRLNGIVGIWADRAEMINPASFVKKQRASRF